MVFILARPGCATLVSALETQDSGGGMALFVDMVGAHGLAGAPSLSSWQYWAQPPCGTPSTLLPPSLKPGPS